MNIDLREKIKNRLSFPIVVKPNNEGSSIGVKICKNFKSLIREFKKLSKIYENLLFETYIPGQIQVALIGVSLLVQLNLDLRENFMIIKLNIKNQLTPLIWYLLN